MTAARFLTIAMALAVVGSSVATAAEPFRRLPGRALAERLAGRELTDDVHWAYGFERGGRLRAVSMGTLRTGSWRVRGDELCLDGGPNGARCFQVWAAGDSIELRRGDGSLPDAGTLRKPQARR
ncbi:lipocalin family protein [Methylobacterium fujisawaense]|uniref:lipocalin family protein n=1 Tax=Methylobacterium fujisawaense TaxID=107400 RepID=UPI00313ABEE9